MKRITAFICVFMQIGLTFAQHAPIHPDNICTVCERINSFDQLIARTSEAFWPGFSDPDYKAPLFYFTQSYTYIFFAPPKLLKHFDTEKKECPNGLKFNRSLRIDSIPFHMSNQVDTRDPHSPYYKTPIMFCSEVAAATKQVPEVANTEEWAAIVLHEYFHSFQLNHSTMMNWLTDRLEIKEDSLINLYRQNEWFKNAIDEENALLLQAIQTASADSAKALAKTFIEKRKDRRERFKSEKGFDVGEAEDFWEKMEGTARYVEYYVSYIYMGSIAPPRSCDSAFNNYRTYKKQGFENTSWMHDKTTIMPAYYYVTGFNICRLMDKLKISYKKDLFDRTGTLTGILERGLL
jgi:hypothetical protein